MYPKTYIHPSALALVLLIAPLAETSSAVSSGEVTLSGTTYTAKRTRDGVITTVYTGSDYFSAVNAAINNLTTGRTAKERVTIRSGGSSGSTPAGVKKSIHMKPYTIVDFQNQAINCNGGNDIIAIRADRSDNIEIRNVRVTGNPGMGFYIQSCNNTTLSGVNMAFSGSTNGMGIRADNYTRYRYDYTKYMTGFRTEGTMTFSGMTGNQGNNHGLETANIEGVIGNVTSTDVGSAGVLLNRSRNTTVGTVTGIRCDEGGSYAAFRAANQGGPNMRVAAVISRDCGRGVFTTTDSVGLDVDRVDLQRSSQGILLQTGYGSSIGTAGVSSVIFDCPEAIRIDDGHTDSTFTQITLRDDLSPGTRRGIWETDGSGNNDYINCDARNNGTGNPLNVVVGAGSTFTGGYR